MTAPTDETVHTPASIAEALQILRRNPEIALWAGGTWQGLQEPPPGHREGELMALHGIRELKRVVRSEIHVDVGAAVAIARLREAGNRFLPPVLMRCLERTGPPPVRNLATLGGALCIPEGLLPVSLVLQLLDCEVEFRRPGRSRMVPLSSQRHVPGEIMSRIRIPLVEWSHWMLETFGAPWPVGEPSLTIAAVAHVEKGSLQDLRLGILIDGHHVMRIREAEMDLASRPLPLTERDQRTILAPLEQHRLYGTELNDLGRWRASGAVRQFLRRLG